MSDKTTWDSMPKPMKGTFICCAIVALTFGEGEQVIGLFIWLLLMALMFYIFFVEQ
tara:strand:+ start:270 stop:437 length:168 start_codon:yes stop_codon:yes gene_type:complete